MAQQVPQPNPQHTVGHGSARGSGSRTAAVPEALTPNNSELKTQNSKLVPTAPLPVIQVEHVTKNFGEVQGVEDLSFEVYEGEIFGFIGPSGSGKTTTMRLLNGIYKPTSGTVRLLGADPAKPTRHLHEGFGYMPQQFVLYPNLTIYENINFLAAIQGLGWRERRKRIESGLKFVELWDARNRLTENTSGGMQRRLELAGALIHDPRLLFVDEPTAGIDPVLRAKFWDEFRRLREVGHTIFVTTQYVGESEYCDRVGVIRKGKLMAVGTPLELRRFAIHGDIVELEASNLGQHEGAFGRLLSQPYVIKAPDGKAMYEWLVRPTTMRIHVQDAGDAIPQMTQLLQNEGVEITGLKEFRPTFDDVFVQLMGDTSDLNDDD